MPSQLMLVSHHNYTLIRGLYQLLQYMTYMPVFSYQLQVKAS